MAHKISLIERQTTPNLLWNEYAGNPFSDEKINEIGDNIGDLEIPVTSIPSPFAQLHLFETAFRFINEDHKREGISSLEGNSTYHKIISNCIDLFEILYSYELLSLKNKIRIEIWDHSELDKLTNSKEIGKGLRTFAETLKVFIKNYNQDKRFKVNQIPDPFNTISLIIYDKQIVAASSPYTGFYTIPDELPHTLKNLDNRPFFSNNLPLYKRNPDFQKFINLFFVCNPKMIGAFKAVHEYIKLNRAHASEQLQSFFKEIEDNKIDKNLEEFNKFKVLDINNQNLYLLGTDVLFKYKSVEDSLEKELRKSDYLIRTRKILDKPPIALLKDSRKTHWKYIRGKMPENLDIDSLNNIDYEERKLPGTEIQYPCFSRNDFLSKNLIRLRYKINTTKFWHLTNNKVQNILLPILPDYFKFFTIEDLQENITIDALNTGGIVVKLKIPVQGDDKKGFITYERTYNEVNPENVDNDNNGAIINSTLGLGIYPFFKVAEKQYNDFYNILQYFASNEKFSSSFYRQKVKGPYIESVNQTSEIDRTRKEENLNIITRYIELSSFSINEKGELIVDYKRDNTFELISLKWIVSDRVTAFGLIIPLLGEEIQLQRTESSLAIDIGTSNSFVAYSIGTNEPSDLSTNIKSIESNSFQLVMLHEVQSEYYADDRKFDFNARVGAEFAQPQYCEYMPVMISRGSKYSFPIRTLVNQDNDASPSKIGNLKFLSNINIPFAFNTRMLRGGFDNAISNLKWGTADPLNTGSRNRLQAFIEEVAILGRNKLLTEGKHPELTNLIWFKPLSMSADQATTFVNIWNQVYKKYFIKQKKDLIKLISITESWAPFHSHNRSFGAGVVYLNIDIGGGTSDILVFKDDKPYITSSFRFAGDSLFDNGINTHNIKDNGFITKYQSLIEKSLDSDSELIEISQYIYKHENLKSTDLICFYFTLQQFRDLLMLDKDFQILFLIHNSAIFYHTFQMIKNVEGITWPNKIGLSGNGSKLLEVTNRNTDLNRYKGFSKVICKIAQQIFELQDVPKIELEILENPKTSTAYGGIRGLNEIKRNQFADLENYFIALGDSQTLLKQSETKEKKKFLHSTFLSETDSKIEDIANNVLAFFNLLFDELWYDCEFVNQFGVDKSFNHQKLKDYFTDIEKIKSSLRAAVNYKLNTEHEQEMNESFFFYPIKAYLYDFSKILANEAECKKFKD